jgi:hypothetical protein
MDVTKLRHTDMRYRRRGMRRVVGLSILCAREFCMGLKWGIENFHAIGNMKFNFYSLYDNIFESNSWYL